MDDQGTGKPPRSRAHILTLVAGILVFGVLLGAYTYLEQTWLRVLVTAFAGGVLGWVLIQAQSRKS